MASNGGTLHGLPQSVAQQQQQHICGQCGLYFESGSSLQVHHMHYHHHQHDGSMNRWDTQQAVVSTTIATAAVATTTTAATNTTNGPSSTTTPTSSDTENNNQPPAQGQGPSPAGGLKPAVAASPPQQHTTIAAAADSSDNQPPTPQPQGTLTEPGTPQSYGGGASPYHAQQQQQQQQQLGVTPTGLGAGGEMHYPTYIHPGYDPGSYYGAGGAAGLDYGGGGGGVLGASLQSADYKSVSSLRYHPYGSVGSNGGSDGGSAAGSAAGLSPHVVSSSNGVQSAGAGTGTTVASTTSASSSQSPPNGTAGGGSHIPPTPSPSPIQCDKCGLVCESDEALHQHESTVHSGAPPGDGQTAAAQDQRQTDQDMQQGGGGGGGCYPYGGNGPGTPQFPKEEPPASDILDLDSQKMVYTPTADGGGVGGLTLPPMNSLHPLQTMQRHHPMMWPHHDPHSFMGPPPPPPEMKHSAAAAAAAAAAYYHHPIKSEYSATPTIKSEYLGGGQYAGGTGPVLVKNEYNLAPTLPPPVAVAPQPTNPQVMKQYADEMHDNQLATSPSDFPSTTTPQESGSQYRTFEPATSSLPGPGPGPTKGTAWKSNEARRPKTYNCTACNKWFTSSGHLKRHYNTTLHKNAVKSSGQPDPATLPISVHHHPGRDPNYASKSRRGASGATGGTGGGGGGGGSQQPLQQPVPPPDPPRSPEYGAAPGPQHQYGMGGPQSGFAAAAGTPPHSGGQVVVVSSNQSPGGFPHHPHHHPHHHSQHHHHHHHPYAGSNGTAGSAAAGQSQHHGSTSASSSSTSSAVPPNGVAGPSVQVSQPRGLQIYSNNNSSSSSSNSNTGPLSGTASLAEPTAEEPVTHTIITILTPTTPQPTSTTTSSTTIPGCTPGTRTPQPPPLPPPQPQPPHTTSSTEGYHPLHPIQPPPLPQPTTQPQPTTCSPLTISTSIPSFQTILPEAPSYHPTIGNVAGFAPSYHQHQPFLYQPLDHQHSQLQGDVQQQQQWLGDGGESLIESTSTTVALGFPRCAGGAEMYQGDTAPPFSPNVPDQYQRPSSQGMMTTLLDDSHQPKYGDFQQHHYLQQQQQLQRVATPQHAATAPSISPAPCSPSVTSTAGKQSATGSGGSSGSPPSSTELHRCEECDKVFNKACYLTQHNKTFHSGDKPYKCHRCGKRFPCNDSYEEHLAKHGGEKPFKCEQCPKQFNHKTDLRRHMCLHSGTKPYACEQCGKGFIRKDHMLKHSETHRRGSGAAAGGGHGHRRAKAGLKDPKFRQQQHLQQQAPGGGGVIVAGLDE